MESVANQSELTIERVLSAPRALVWEAWTDPKHAAHWWGPPGCTIPLFEADLRPGGRYRIDMELAPGVGGRAEGIHEEIVEPERLVRVGSLEFNGVKVYDARMTVTFEEDGDKTKVTIQMTLSNMSASSAEHVAGVREGWKLTFDKLEAYLRQ